MAFEKDPNEIGVLWQKHGKKGAYMTGEILGQKVVIFAISSENPKAPNWRVLKSVPKDGGETMAGGFQVEARENIGTDRDDLGF